MNEKQHDHEQDEPCKYHKSMCDSLVKFAAHIKDLREENAVMSKTLHEVATTVRAINETLIGTLEKQGMIGRVDKQYSDMVRELNDLKTWKQDIMQWKLGLENKRDAITLKLIGAAAGGIVGGGVVAVAIVRWMVG